MDILVSLLAEFTNQRDWILDLGYGSGKVEELIFERIPHCQVVSIDNSETMAQLALERLSPYTDRFIPLHGDLAELSNLQLPVSEVGVVIAIQSLHHLSGLSMPPLRLPATNGEYVRVDEVPVGFERLVIYAYPLTDLPGVNSPDGWEQIPGARGCTPESCGFRDIVTELSNHGVFVMGLSIQSTAYQREAVERLHLPYPLLSDAAPINK